MPNGRSHPIPGNFRSQNSKRSFVKVHSIASAPDFYSRCVVFAGGSHFRDFDACLHSVATRFCPLPLARRALFLFIPSHLFYTWIPKFPFIARIKRFLALGLLDYRRLGDQRLPTQLKSLVLSSDHDIPGQPSLSWTFLFSVTPLP